MSKLIGECAEAVMRSVSFGTFWDEQDARLLARATLSIAFPKVLAIIAEEEQRWEEPEVMGALMNVRNAINAMMEEPSP